MKISILQQDLLPALQATSRSVGIKANLPVLGNILLQTEQGKLKISATNLEVGVIKKINAQVLEEGEVTVPARTFLELISALSGAKLELESSGEQLKVAAKNFNAIVNGIAAAEFPAIPLSTEQSVSISSRVLEQAVPQITFAAASDEARPILTGILTEIKKDTLELVATDGFRLAHKTVKLAPGEQEPFKALIPRRTFEEVVRLISEHLKSNKQDASVEDKVQVGTSENQNQMIFQIGQTQLSSRLIEGSFPTWEKIIPPSFENRTIVERGDFLRAVKLATIFAKDAASVVKVETGQGQIRLKSEAKELGNQETEIEAQVEGADIVIAFNGRFLVEALSACSSSQVSVEFSGNVSPAVIKPLGEEGLEYVIMPIRLS